MPKTTSSSTKKGSSAKMITKPSAHPSWVDMIKECVVAHPEDARMGVSRPIIKKFIESKYKITMDASHTSQLSRAIISGFEKGVFVLPKGPSGKVKLAPKAKADTVKEMNKAEKENKKAAKVSTAVPKKSAAPKKTLATKENNKAAVSKSPGVKAQTTRKPAAKAQSKTISRTPVPRPVKKLAAKTKTFASKKPEARTTKRKTSSKKNDAKKAVAKIAASKTKKPASRTKPGSKSVASPKKPNSKKSTKSASATAKPASTAKA